MGTFTTQIMVGQSHTYDGGIINISHMLFLSENSMPAWILLPFDVFEKELQNPNEERMVWCPSVNNMLEDALLMIGIYVLKDSELIKMAENLHKGQGRSTRIDLTELENPDLLNEMYRRSRQIGRGIKIVLSVFEGSSIHRHLKVLEKYHMEVEVTKTSYKRSFNPWNRTIETNGSLEITD